MIQTITAKKKEKLTSGCRPMCGIYSNRYLMLSEMKTSKALLQLQRSNWKNFRWVVTEEMVEHNMNWWCVALATS